MTGKQNAVLTLTFIACLTCGVFAALAVSHEASLAAVGWAFAALFFGGSFKICAQDFGVFDE